MPTSTLLEAKPSLKPFSLLTTDQQAAIDRLYQNNTLLVGDMGSGKTIVAAMAITELLNNRHLTRVLVITTPKIAKTVWKQEFNGWEYADKISVGVATGTPEERDAVYNGDTQVVIATFDTLPAWASKYTRKHNFDGLLIDETTKLKKTGGAQYRALKRNLPSFKWRCGLTGTPVAEDFEGLFGQCQLIDNGRTLGRSITNYRMEYFHQKPFNQYAWFLNPGADKLIVDRIKHLIHVLPDYRHTLPTKTLTTIKVEMPPELTEHYRVMKKDMVVGDVEAVNAAVLTQKLQQIASGFLYDTESGEVERLSDYRMERIRNLISSMPSENVIICYWYQEELAMLKETFPDAVTLGSKKELNQTVNDWNAGVIKTLLLHPRSAGHGLNLAQGGRIMVWLAPQWSNDLWEQTNARLWRRGQERPVNIITLEAVDTVDELVSLRVELKAGFDKMLRQHLNR